MSDLVFSTLWCAGQVTLIAAVAGLCSLFLLKRNPASAARLLAVASVLLLALSLVVAAPIPEWSIGNGGTEQVAATGLDSVESSMQEAVPASTPPAGFNWSRLRFPARAHEAVASIREASPSSNHGVGTAWLVLLATGVVLGLIRIAGGLWSLHCLRKSAQAIEKLDPVHAIAAELSDAIGLTDQRIRLSESSEVDCAAVLGFGQSTILLANDWREWEQHELRTVLAHELAHVARRDAFWRMVSVFASAVHFFNPLVHWLTARMVLAQELAADRLALESMEQGTYVRSLSRLALRHDSNVSGSHMRTSPFTPVFAGHLLRRIEMLVAKDCADDRQGRCSVSYTHLTLPTKRIV